MGRIRLEVCVPDLESALAAERGGADRVELCDELAIGGTTPPAEAIAAACRRLSIPVHVLIRPRGGDFCYDEAEFQAMLRDVDLAVSLGATGVVFGILNRDGSVDLDRNARLIERARPLSVTFHKAFDEASEPDRAFDDLDRLGVDRLLTSGRAERAVDGLALIEAAGAAGRSTRRS